MKPAVFILMALFLLPFGGEALSQRALPPVVPWVDTYLAEEGNNSNPCSPSSTPEWTDAALTECTGVTPPLKMGTRSGNNYIVIPQGNYFYFTNITITEMSVITIAIDFTTNFSLSASNDAGWELTAFNGFTDITYIRVIYSWTAGQSVMLCGDEAGPAPSQNIRYGSWSASIIVTGSGIFCFIHDAELRQFFSLDSATCGGATCDLTDIDKAWLLGSSGTDELWVNYYRIKQGEHDESESSCEDFGFCGDPVAVVNTLAASSVRPRSVRMNGDLISFPATVSSVDVWFQWGTDEANLGSLDFPELWNETSHQFKSATGTFQAALFILQPETTYFFRAVVQINGGGNYSSYGATKNFTTTADPILVDLGNAALLLGYTTSFALLWLSLTRYQLIRFQPPNSD